jgi:hypothetical protein
MEERSSVWLYHHTHHICMNMILMCGTLYIFLLKISSASTSGGSTFYQTSHRYGTGRPHCTIIWSVGLAVLTLQGQIGSLDYPFNLYLFFALKFIYIYIYIYISLNFLIYIYIIFTCPHKKKK